jgi:hypothetical protein
MSDGDKIKADLVQASLTSYAGGYRALADDWKNLDGKAQGTVAIAGVFLAGVFGFVKSLADRKPQVDGSIEVATRFCVTGTDSCITQRNAESLLLGLAVLGLFSAVLLAVMTLRVRLVRSPSGAEVDEMAQDAARLVGGGHDQDIPQRFVAEQLVLWRDAVVETGREYLRKGRQLEHAQLAILVGASAVTVLTLIEIFNA